MRFPPADDADDEDREPVEEDPIVRERRLKAERRDARRAKFEEKRRARKAARMSRPWVAGVAGPSDAGAQRAGGEKPPSSETRKRRKEWGGNPLKWVDEDEGVKRKKSEKKGREGSSDDEEDPHDDGLPPITGPSVLDAPEEDAEKLLTIAAAATTSGDTGSDAAGDAARIGRNATFATYVCMQRATFEATHFFSFFSSAASFFTVLSSSLGSANDGLGWCTCPRRCASLERDGLGVHPGNIDQRAGGGGGEGSPDPMPMTRRGVRCVAAQWATCRGVDFLVASSLRRYLSFLQAGQGSAGELTGVLLELHLQRSNRVNASAVAPAKPPTTPGCTRRTLVTFGFTTWLPSVTCPSAISTTSPSLRTHNTVVACAEEEEKVRPGAPRAAEAASRLTARRNIGNPRWAPRESREGADRGTASTRKLDANEGFGPRGRRTFG